MSTRALACAALLLVACGESEDPEAEIRRRAVERAGDDTVELCRVARAHAGTPEGARAEELVSEQLAGWQGRLAEAREPRRLHEGFATWLEGLLTAQENAACTPLTVQARIHFERTEENAEASVQENVERTVEAAVETHDREVLAQAVAEALAPLTGVLVPASRAVRVGEDEPDGTIIDLDVRLTGSDHLELEALPTVTLRQEGGTTSTIELPVVVLPRDSVDPHRTRRTSDAASLTMRELLARARSRFVDGLGLREADPALEPYEGEWTARRGRVSGVCPAADVDLEGTSMTIDAGRRTVTVGERVFDAWVEGDELIAESHRIGGPCRTRLSEILRFGAAPEGPLDGRWTATFMGHEECERRCTRSADLDAARQGG